MTTEDRLNAAREEFFRCKTQVEALPRGPVRSIWLKKQAEASSRVVELRQQLIAEQAHSPNPRHIPRESFGIPEPEGADL